MTTNIPGIDNPICQKCGLWKTCKTPFMNPSTVYDDPLIMVVGESPGFNEDSQGVPFVGASGKKLREVLEAVGIDTNDIVFTNTVRCRPPDNKIYKKHINYCKQFMLQEIEEYNPELVLLLGNSPLGAVLGESGITNWNGVVIEREDRAYIPLFHPAYILRNPAVMDDWLEGFIKVKELLDGEYAVDNERKLVYPNTVKEIEKMVDYIIKFDVVAYDTETSTLDPFDDNAVLLSCSFSVMEKTGNTVSYSFPIDHFESPFDDTEIDKIFDLLCYFFNNYEGIVTGHNLKFDWKWTKHVVGCEFRSRGDTILISHMLNARKDGHGLKRLAGLYLGMYDYDKPLRDYCETHPEADIYRGGSYAYVPLDLLLPYGALDTDASIRLYYEMYSKLTVQQQHFHSELLMRASDTIARMEYNGVLLDDHIAFRYFTIYTSLQRDEYTTILENDDIKEMLYDKQRYEDLKIVADAYDITGKYWEKEAVVHKYKVDDGYLYMQDDLPNPRKSKKRKRSIYEFNPNSSFDVRSLLFEYRGIDSNSVPKTKTGLPSVRAGYIKQFAKGHPVVENIRYYNLLDKMISTYLRPAYEGDWKSDDGRVRSSYNLGITKTSRLSSSSPNLQNIPAPEKEPGTLLEKLPIKNIFTHTYPDGVVMSIDYAGMELRVVASVADCKNMKLAFAAEKDVHSMVALYATKHIPLSEVTHEQIVDFRKHSNSIRHKFKSISFALGYGGSAYTLHKSHGFPLDECEMFVSMYFKAFPEILVYQEDAKQFAYSHGYIESVFGRRLQLHYINDMRDSVKSKRNHDVRTALNMPIQSAASDILLAALGVIDDQMQQRGMKSMLTNTVHDSIMFDCYPDEIDEVAALGVDVMENIKVWAKDYYPNVSFDWLTCPLKADVEVGTHYGSMEHYEVKL